MAKIFTVAELPDDLVKSWLQHLRDFDTAHPGCHFEIAADIPDMPLAIVVDMLLLNPGLDFKAIFERAPKK